MSIVTATVRQVTATATIASPTTPTIYNVTTPVAPNTETSQALNPNTKKFSIAARGTARLQYAFVATESGTIFKTLWPGALHGYDMIDFTGTMYFQANQASAIVEILEWV